LDESIETGFEVERKLHIDDRDVLAKQKVDEEVGVEVGVGVGGVRDAVEENVDEILRRDHDFA
jgi:hypothetical protein